MPRAFSVSKVRSKTRFPSAGPGDVVAIARLEGVKTGDTLSTSAAMKPRPVTPIAEPLFAVAIKPKERLDEAKVSQMLARLLEEDPTLRVARAEFTGELQLLGNGEVHVATAMSRLARKYHLALEANEPAVPYRETIGDGTHVRARYKHQTGGHGQFADVALRIEPRERGHGITFSEEIVGGVVPRQFFPAVEKGVREALGRGPIARFPVVGRARDARRRHVPRRRFERAILQDRGQRKRSATVCRSAGRSYSNRSRTSRRPFPTKPRRPF